MNSSAGVPAVVEESIIDVVSTNDTELQQQQLDDDEHDDDSVLPCFAIQDLRSFRFTGFSKLQKQTTFSRLSCSLFFSALCDARVESMAR